jgi:translation initiation factor eIF-2B subunit alpha
MRLAVTKLPSLQNTRTSRSTPWQKGSRSHQIHLTIFRVYSISFKFRRLFPLSQYDLPTHGPGILPFPRHVPEAPLAPAINEQPSGGEPKDAVSPGSTGTGSWMRKSMSVEQVALNPEVDYTK